MLEPNRLFFALYPDTPVRSSAQAAARTLKVKMQTGGYLSTAERYHITLLFLGDFVSSDGQAAAIEAAARTRCPPFVLRLDRAGSFRKAKIPWWLGPSRPPPELGILYQNLHAQLLEAKVVPDRMKFVPHLTVLRDAGAVLPTTTIDPIDWQVNEFVLVRSRLDLKPVRHEILGRWPLLEGAQPQAPAGKQLDLW